MNYLAKKLPAPIATQINGLINNEAAVVEAEKLLGSLVDVLGKNAKTKKIRFQMV
jgi:hypothetical protein